MAVLGLRFCARAFPSRGSGGHSSSRCAGLSPSRPLPSRSTGSRRAGPAAVAHGPSCSAACGILPNQGSNPCALHWQADSQPLRHQGSPRRSFNFPWCCGSVGGTRNKVLCPWWSSPSSMPFTTKPNWKATPHPWRLIINPVFLVKHWEKSK